MPYSRDFLLREIQERFASFRQYALMRDVIDLPTSPDDRIILRFDVERDLEHHKLLARKFADTGIQGTFYFHTRRECYAADILREIAGMGHEIGFHHECIDRCGGDFDKARELFCREVDLFRRDGFELLTVCGHGEAGLPKQGYRFNWELFDRFPNLLSDLGIKGEVYLWLRDHDPLYASDTFSNYPKFERKLAQAKGDPRIMMVLIHLHRWRANFAATTIEIGRDLGRQLCNRILRRRGYRLAYEA